MVAGVAHEINNPLSFVGNNVAVLQRDLAEIQQLIALYHKAHDIISAARPDLFEAIETLCERTDMNYTLSNLQGLLQRTREGLKRIQHIVKELRVFARLDEGELDQVNLNDGIESTVTIVMGNAKRKQVTITLDLQPLPTVTCYGARINQVVMNLVSNAIDACREGGRVTVRSRPEADGDWVRIEVEDTGSGIAPEIRDKIFDPFFTTKPVGIGSGLGLSISYGIVQDHGGTIEVDSTPGVGSTFTVRLPRQLIERPPARRRSTSGASPDDETGEHPEVMSQGSEEPH